MALFNKKQETEKEKKAVVVPVKKASEKPASTKAKSATPKAAKKEKAAPAASKVGMTPALERVLVRPRITEKAAQATAAHMYTFEVASFATKTQVKAAVQATYGVQPIKVAIVNTPAKRVSLRTRRGYGTKKAHKKAYVFLKEGDRIDFAS